MCDMKKQLEPAIRKTPLSGHKIERHLDVWDVNDHINKPKCTLFGRPCQQAFTAFFLWEKLLGPLEFARFIEVGTGYGNTSMFFMLHCLQKGAQFHTFDQRAKRVNNSSPLKALLDLHGHATVGNVWSPEIRGVVRNLCAQPGRTVLFMDGGDKPYEFELFVPRLKMGDIVAVHDWGRAIKQQWVQETIEARCLTPIMADEHTKLETLTMMWEVTL